MQVLLLLFFSFFSSAFSFQFPFKVPFFNAAQDHVKSTTPNNRIAIIGGGAAGSSSAFWISKAKERFGVDVEIDVYEKNEYIGGRSITVQPYEDVHIELGASIFVKANKNLWRAADEFNLTRKPFKDEEQLIGIYDGENIVVTFSNSWWDTLKIVWRYGIMSPKRVQTHVDSMVKQFLTFYSPSAPRWDSISGLAETMGWTKYIEHTTFDYFSSLKIDPKFTNELVEGATRVNYGQNADSIHALEGLVSMSANDATSIVGGNFQIFEGFLARSNATVFLNTTVTHISPKSDTSHYWTVGSKGRSPKDYRAVILAAPFHSTDISVPSTIAAQIPKQPYVHLHVTLLTTTSPTFKASYFGLPAESKNVPTMVLTTSKGNKEPEFNSISYHGLVKEGVWAVKVFSKAKLSDEWLSTIIDGEIKWVYRKEWDAYPIAPPTTSFPPVRLARGLFYVNSFEPFISTMETETISARNTADLLLSEEFGHGICGHQLTSSDQAKPHNVDKDFVLGWDC